MQIFNNIIFFLYFLNSMTTCKTEESLLLLENTKDDIDTNIDSILEIEKKIITNTSYFSKETFGLITIVPPLIFLTNACYQQTYALHKTEEEKLSFLQCFFYHVMKFFVYKKI